MDWWYSEFIEFDLHCKNVAEQIRKGIMSKLLRGEGVSVTYEEPDQSPYVGDYCLIMDHVWWDELDYNLQYPFKHFTTWFMNLFMGNVKEFNEEMNSLSETELKKKLLSRESYFQSTSLFHVIEGAKRLHPKAKVRPSVLIMRGPSEMEHLQIFEKLIEAGADINARDIRGHTPLFYCLQTVPKHGNEVALSMAKLLLAKGADVNARCRQGRTVLNRCVEAKHEENIKFLIKEGARTNIKDNAGLDAMVLVMGNLRIKNLLRGAEGEEEEISLRNEKMAARKDKLRDACSSCQSTTRKRCGGCFLEWFCSPECIKKEWPVHKVACKKRRSEYIGLAFVRALRCEYLDDKDAFLSKLKTVNPSNSHFIVKIHLDGSLHPLLHREILIQNKEMSVDIVVERSTGQANILINVIKNKGINGVYGFFAAFVKDEKIFIHPDIQPVQIW